MTRLHFRTVGRRDGARLALGAVVAVCLAATPARAQDTTLATAPADSAAASAAPVIPGDGTHVVKAGETLWELARVYFNDPFLWPEIYRVNTDVVEDPHWIYPGQRLAIPTGILADTTTTTIAVVPVPDPGPTIPAPEARPSGTIRATDDRVRPVRPVGTSIFSRRDQVRQARGPVRLSDVGREEYTSVKPGEFYAAPFVVRGGPRDAGRIVASSVMSGIAQRGERLHVQFNERVYAELPRGARGTVGDRYMSYELGPNVDGLGRIVVPTGILEVRATHRDAAAEIQLVEMYDDVEIGQGLIPLDSFTLDAGARPAAVSSGARGKVAWISEDPVLPSIQRYLVLTATGRDGVRPGDQFTLIRERMKSADGVQLPEDEIAVVQVIRVTNHGTTAMIIQQSQPAISLGTPARLSAKMP
jgi:hypothetical protein